VTRKVCTGVTDPAAPGAGSAPFTLSPNPSRRSPEMPKRMYGCNTENIQIEYALNTLGIQPFQPVGTQTGIVARTTATAPSGIC
jgi:hypothetical protein